MLGNHPLSTLCPSLFIHIHSTIAIITNPIITTSAKPLSPWLQCISVSPSFLSTLFRGIRKDNPKIDIDMKALIERRCQDMAA